MPAISFWRNRHLPVSHLDPPLVNAQAATKGDRDGAIGDCLGLERHALEVSTFRTRGGKDVINRIHFYD